MSNPKPAIVFKTNVPTPGGNPSSLPSPIQPHGSETISEAAAQLQTRSVAFFGGVNAGMNVTGYEQGQQFTLYGSNALYFQKTYCPGTPDDVFSVVSISWADGQ